MTTPTKLLPTALTEIAIRIAELLRNEKETISVAETAAGGLISAALLSTPGASKIYRGGLTLYTLESRVRFAGWKREDIDNYRGPTTEIVEGLAKSVREQLDSTYCVSESGTAGPTGGSTPNRKPGYVALAVASESEVFSKELDTGHGQDRHANMLAFAIEALNLVLETIEKASKNPKV